MKNLKFLPGTQISNVGKVEALHFTDLFNASYVVDENYYTEEDIKDKILSEKDVLISKLFDLLQRNKSLAVKFLTKMALKTQNIPVINGLNEVIEDLDSLLSSEDFTWNSYRDYTSAKKLLKSFMFTYTIKHI